MILPKFEFQEPTSIQAACSILEQNSGKAKVIAGGTDLLVNLKKKLGKPEVLISLDKIAEMKGLSYSDDRGLRIGPLVTMAELSQSKMVIDKFPALVKAASKVGTPQIRNRATIGGNICSARPAADTIGPLIGYGAQVKLVGPQGEKQVDLEKFFTGPGGTILRPTEVLTDIVLGPPILETRGSYIKVGIRKTAEIAIVSVTSVITLDPRNGECRNVRIVLGAVAPTFIRCQASERVLIGKKINEELAAQAGTMATRSCLPISDLRGSEDYRRMLVEVLTKRTLLEAIEAHRT